MRIKTKVFVVLAFVVAAFYSLEVVLTVIKRGLVSPAFVKAGLVVALIYYAISAIKKSKVTNAPSVN